ncbi:MAG TPA: S8 family serine peptidase [Candidatus Eisenbacteria bacterium]
MRASSRAAILVSAMVALGSAAASGADPPRAAPPSWVFFRDRGDLAKPGPAREAALAEASRRITPRAAMRRAKAARERDRLASRGVAARPGSAPRLAPRPGSAPRLAARPEPVLLPDDQDLPPDPAYVAAVSARGGVIRTRSRWLNAVSVDASPEALERIGALPFVAGIRPVARESRDEAPATDAEFNAGPSYLQIDMLHVPEVHSMGLHGEGILVCVLDSGFELDHEALRQLEVRGVRDFVNGDSDPSYDPRTDAPTQSIHGTAVLSTIGGYAPGRLIGPAYRADYLLGMTERVGSERPVEEDFWCAGVEWAEAVGADLLTSSLTYHAWYRWRDLDGRTAVATRAANLALSRGLLIVNAIGNEGQKEGSIGAPADAPGAISVGAVNGIGNLAGFSSVGPTYDRRVKPDVVAPGVSVLTALGRTRDAYARVNGTSFSTPLVAGVVALIMERHPDWGPEMVRDALTMSASRAERPDNRFGWGLVNAREAVLYPLIEGVVTDFYTREPLQGATVRWEPAGSVDSLDAAASDSPPRGTVETDSTGAYVIPSLPRGSFKIRISKAGYFDADAGPYDVPPNLGDANVALRYREK